MEMNQVWIEAKTIEDGMVELEIGLGYDGVKYVILAPNYRLAQGDIQRLDLPSRNRDVLRPCDPDDLLRFPDGSVGVAA